MLLSYKSWILKLHSIISWSATPLRADPVNILTVVLDIAGLAVDAVGGVDDEVHVATVIRLVFVHPSRTESEVRNKMQSSTR